MRACRNLIMASVLVASLALIQLAEAGPNDRSGSLYDFDLTSGCSKFTLESWYAQREPPVGWTGASRDGCDFLCAVQEMRWDSSQVLPKKDGLASCCCKYLWQR